MVRTQFGAILKELEPFFKCPLEPDQNNSCLIKLGIGLSVQVEMDRYGLLLIGCVIGTLPMTRYRENIIQQALKSNELSLPSAGSFGFSHKTNHLIYFIRLDPVLVSMDQILSLLPSFISKAKKWSDAIAKGEMPPLEETNVSNAPTGLFGLMS